MKYICYAGIFMFGAIALGISPLIVVPIADESMTRHLAILGVMQAFTLITYLTFIVVTLRALEKEKHSE